MPRRPAHKLAHARCPYGVFNWSDCDATAAHQWGRCKAEVERKGAAEPGDCVRWAQDKYGYCIQHFMARHEKDMGRGREAARQLQLEERYLAFVELQEQDPDYWLRRLSTSAESTQGLAGVAGVEPAKVVLETAPPPRLTPGVRKGPHRIDATA